MAVDLRSRTGNTYSHDHGLLLHDLMRGSFWLCRCCERTAVVVQEFGRLTFKVICEIFLHEVVQNRVKFREVFLASHHILTDLLNPTPRDLVLIIEVFRALEVNHHVLVSYRF